MKTKKMRSKHVVPGPKSPDNFLKRNRWLLAMIVAVAAMVAVPLAKQQAQTEVDSDTKEALQRGSSQKVEANETGVITMTASQLENIPANVTGVSPGSGVDFGEESEPNDLFTSANPLSGSAGKIRGDIFPNGDEDWFSFTANTGDRVYAAVQTSYSNNGSSDSQLRVFASDGSTLLEFDDDDGVQGGLSSTVAGTVIPSNGTYYMQVKHFSATNSLRPYELYFRVQSGAPSTETESNDSPGTANSLPSNGWVSGARDPAAATEQDWFSFTANAGDTIYLGLDLDPERDNVQWNGRLGIALFGDANNQILVVDDGSTGSAANPLSEAMFMTVKNSGTYYGFVDSASAATGGPTATYNLSITRIPKTTVGVSCTTYTSTDVPKVIGPGAGLVSSTITVPPTMARIASTKVSITADHALMADMDVNLRSPNNNENGLFNDIGATATGGQTMMDLTLDQYSSGVPFLFTVVRPLVLKPELNYRLDWFDGENPSGVWTLDVRDDLTNTSGGNLTAWSLEVCEQAPVTGSVIYTEDFEANDGGFTHSGTADEWEYGTPATAATTTTNPIASIVGCNSGTNCWKTDLDNTYDVSSNQDLVSPSIAVPAGTNTLSWAMRYQMESANFDHARVLVREVGNPTNAKTVWEWRGATMTLGVGSPTVNIGESAGWGIHNADISAFAGMNVEIVFHLDSDSSIIFAGIAIDDVSIRNTPPGPTPTTTTINSIMPEPSVIGQDYSVNVTVSHGVMPLGGSPTGTVNVSDGTNNCMITLSGGSGSCDLPSTSPGAKTITANYVGNMSSAPSSDSTSHTVNPANTTTTITNAGPLGTPSIVGQPYPVNWSVTVDSPGAGTPTGTVTVTDGTDSCMAAVATGTCNLVSTTTGMKTIVATYNGDANFTSSNSPGVPHTVNPVPMTTVSINDVAQGEANSGPSTMFFTVSLSAPSASPVSVDVTTEDVTATAGSDYIGKLSSTVTIPPGNTSAQFGVTIIGDTIPELDETFNVNLSNAVGAAIGDGQGVGTIENDDASSITINDVTVTEGNSGTTMATFTVTALPANPNPVSVKYATANGTANGCPLNTAVPEGMNCDYVSVAPTLLQFAANETSKTLTISVNGDTTVELDETFFVNLTMPTNATISDAQGLGTITNDDTPNLSITNVSMNEGNSGTTNFDFTVSLDQPNPAGVTVSYATSPSGTHPATAGEDYTTTNGMLTFGPAETTKTVSVPVIGDTVTEFDETFSVTLSGATNANLPAGPGVGTIENDDVPAFTITDVSMNEGNSGTTNFVFTVTLSQANPAGATVAYTTNPGSGMHPATPGADYTTTAGTLTFGAAETSKTITVPVIGDLAAEFDETFVVDLSSPTGATISDNQGDGTIVNDDIPTLSVNTVRQLEGNSGTSLFNFTITLSQAHVVPVTVSYKTEHDSATSSDYVPIPLTAVTFAVGETTKNFSVTVFGDTIREQNEVFRIILSNAANATIANNGAGVIIDEEAFSISDFDGDRVSDYSVYRPSTGVWYSLQSTNGVPLIQTFGLAGDLIAPGDYDGDGKTDRAFFRPSTGNWHVLRSSDSGETITQFGMNGDKPVQGDFDNDGKTDLAVFRPSTGLWAIRQSSNGLVKMVTFGLGTDKPVQGDYDGDGETDIAVYRPSTGTWYVLRSATATTLIATWGNSTDVPVTGDFDGDGKTDLTIFRPSTGDWWIFQSLDNTVRAFPFGTNGDIPAAADFDNDGTTDVAVFRPSSGDWYVLRSSTLTLTGVNWGTNGDIPVPKAYLPQ